MTTPTTLQAEQGIAANPSGRMTDEQKTRVTAAVLADASTGLSRVGALAIVLGIFWLVSYRDFDPASLGAVVFGVPILALLVILGILYWKRAALLAEVQAETVEYATGQVQYVGRGYVATVPGRSLNLSAISLAAGDYDFSFLPRAGWVVAAQLAASDSPTRDQDEMRHALAVGNHFNVDDLPALRQGRLQPGAAGRLRREWSAGVWLLVAAAVAGVVFVYEAAAGNDALVMVLSCLGTMFLGLIGLSIIGSLSGRTQDVFEGKVAAVEGTLQKQKVEVHGYRSSHTNYYYVLDQQKWFVSPDGYRALIEGRPYRLYFLPRSKVLVGIEPLTADLAPAASAALESAATSIGPAVTAPASRADEDAAAANRSGRLTEDQQRTATAGVRAAGSSRLTGCGAITLVLGVILFSLPVMLLVAFNWPLAVGAVGTGVAFFAALRLFIDYNRRQEALLREVQAGHLDHATGHVEFMDGHYQAQVPGRSLDLTGFNLAAGNYDFGYLPLSGRVISAELAGAESPAQARDELRHALAVTNQFNLDDLPTYRTGQLGPLRQRMLRAKLSTYGWLLLATVIFLALSVGAGASSMGPLLVIITVVLVLILVSGLLADYGPTLDVLHGRVAMTEGVVTRFARLVPARGGARHHYYYRLNELSWEVPEAPYQALIEGQTYQVFYLPRSKKLLAIDPVLQEAGAP